MHVTENIPVLVKSSQQMSDILPFVTGQRNQRYPFVHLLYAITLSFARFANVWKFEHVFEDGGVHRQEAFVDFEQVLVGRENDISVWEPQNVVSLWCFLILSATFSSALLLRVDVHLAWGMRGVGLLELTLTSTRGR